MRVTPEALERARQIIAARFGLDVPDSRMEDLRRGLQKVLHAGSPDLGVLQLAGLPDDSPVFGELMPWLTIGETYFFRDRACFDALERSILPALIAERRGAGAQFIRVWSAGCASGEEPYSLAIVLDRLLPDRDRWSISILASDINPRALETAREGLYRSWSLRDTPDAIIWTYFRERGDQLFEVDPRIREMVTFTRLNLAADRYPSDNPDATGLDLIFCKNVLMYFTRDAREAAARRLGRALAPNGFLAVSPAETSIELFHPLVSASFPGAVFYRKSSETWASSGEQSAAPQQLIGGPAASSTLDPPPIWYPAPTPGPFELRDDHPPVAADVALAAPASESADAALPDHVDPATDTTAEPRTDDGPDNAVVRLMERARAAADGGDLAAARVACAAALAADPLFLAAHLLMADIARETGDIGAAREALQRAIFLAPRAAAAHFALGTLLIRHGLHAEGRRSLRAAIGILEAQHPDAPVEGSEGLTAGRIVEIAHELLDAGSATDPAQPRGRVLDA